MAAYLFNVDPEVMIVKYDDIGVASLGQYIIV
jgi:hypothetical protein